MRLRHAFGLILVGLFLIFLFIGTNQEPKRDEKVWKKREGRGSHLRIATYNLWNVNYHWKLRMDRLKEIVYEDKLDIIALQEVRGNSTYSPMLAEIQRVLPEYAYTQYQPALHRPNPHRGDEAEFEYEGVGILSRYNFETLTYHNLSRGRGTDLNVRVVLSAIVEYRPTPSDLYHVGVHVIHWSYDKHQQCQNALETVQYISNFSTPDRPVTILDVMLGDFNIYNEWGAPMEYFHPRSGPLENNCTKLMATFNQPPPRRRRFTFGQEQSPPPTPPPTIPPELDQYFRDGWTEMYPDDIGNTFSTIDTVKGLHVRPDRIIYRATSPVGLEDMRVTEDGEAFSMRYLWVIGKQRLQGVVMFMSTLQEYLGEKRWHKEPCKQDCGPGMKCHCGVCVWVPEKRKSGNEGREENTAAAENGNEEGGLGELPPCPHFQIGFTSILVLFVVGVVSSLLASILICISYSLAKGYDRNGWGSYLLQKHRTRTLCLSVVVVLLLLAWASLAFVLTSVLYPVGQGMYELAVLRVGPDELKTSDHMMVQSSFFFPDI